MKFLAAILTSVIFLFSSAVIAETLSPEAGGVQHEAQMYSHSSNEAFASPDGMAPEPGP